MILRVKADIRVNCEYQNDCRDIDSVACRICSHNKKDSYFNSIEGFADTVPSDYPDGQLVDIITKIQFKIVGKFINKVEAMQAEYGNKTLNQILASAFWQNLKAQYSS